MAAASDVTPRCRHCHAAVFDFHRRPDDDLLAIFRHYFFSITRAVARSDAARAYGDKARRHAYAMSLFIRRRHVLCRYAAHAADARQKPRMPCRRFMFALPLKRAPRGAEREMPLTPRVSFAAADSHWFFAIALLFTAAVITLMPISPFSMRRYDELFLRYAAISFRLSLADRHIISAITLRRRHHAAAAIAAETAAAMPFADATPCCRFSAFIFLFR